MTRCGMFVKYTGQSNLQERVAQSMNVKFKEAVDMSIVKWEAVCRYCGKKCETKSLSDTQGRPNRAPMTPSGKCPSSPDGKHKPQWEKA